MIRIDINGTNGASACGRAVTNAKGPICALARSLIEDGYAAHDITDVYRGHMRVFCGVELGWWAAQSYREGDFSVKRVRYIPMPSDLHAEARK